MSVIPFALDAVPAELRQRPQWVAWIYQERDGKPTKVPVNPRTGGRASSTDASTWAPLDEAIKRMQHDHLAGVGYVFAVGDPFCGVDFDDCIGDDGTIAPAVQDWLRRLGTYGEVSPSGRGVKVIGRAALPGDRHKLTDARRFGCSQIEMYDQARFFTLTGQRLDGLPDQITECQKAIEVLYAACFPPSSPAKLALPTATLADDDAALLDLARAARNGAKFVALFDRGDTSAYNHDDSAADMALCCELAFWTQRDPSRMDRLFRRSALYRPKWDERRGEQTYGVLTIQKAIDQTREVYEPSAAPHPNGHASGKASGSGDEPDKRKESKASALIRLALKEVAELWHTPDDVAYATIVVNRVRQHWPLRSRTFAHWLAWRFYEETATENRPGQCASRDDLAAAVMTLEGIARFDGAEHAVFVRVAQHEGKVYLDLCDAAWRAVEIDAGGWRIVDDPPVRFTRARGMLPLPEPQPGGSLDGLRTLLNVESSDDDWRLLVGWLIGALCPRGPYPVLALFGEQGTAKSTTARLLRGLIDPSAMPLRAEPREVRDLMIAATHSWCVVFDNISHMQRWLSDALCRLSTGGAFGTRELYSDTDEVLLDAMRPVVLTAITDVVDQGDLLDRTLLVRLSAIPEDRRRPESELLAEYERIRPQVLGALYDAVSAALRDETDIRRSLHKLPRLADWACWAVAATRSLGWADDCLLGAFRGRREEGNALALEVSPLGPLLVQLSRAGDGWQGTADELRRACARLVAEAEIPCGVPERAEQVGRHVEHLLTRDKEWPRNGRAMRALLDRLAPHLRASGVSVEYPPRDGHEGKRVIRLRAMGVQSSAPSASSVAAPHTASSADGSADDCVGTVRGPSAQSSARQPLPDKGSDDADGADGPAPSAQGDPEEEAWTF